MKALSLTVSASLIALAGCRNEPIAINSGPVDAGAVAPPSGAVPTDGGPVQVPAKPPVVIHANPSPR
jgi:hypothetical protein